MAGLQLNFQDFSATVTNPGLIPVDTNANLQSYHRNINPSTPNDNSGTESNASLPPAFPLRGPQLPEI